MKRAAWILFCVLVLAAPPALAGRGGSRGKPRRPGVQRVQRNARAERVPPPGQRGGQSALGQTRRQAADTGARPQRTEQSSARRGGQKIATRPSDGAARLAPGARALDPALATSATGGRRPGRVRTFLAATAVAVATLLGVTAWQSFDMGSRALDLWDSARNQIEQTIDDTTGGGSATGSGGSSGPSAPAPTPPGPDPQPDPQPEPPQPEPPQPEPSPPLAEEGPARPVGSTLRPPAETGAPTVPDR